MGLFSWISSCGMVGESGTLGDERPNLIRTNVSNPQLDELRQAAAADVALIESDNRRPGQADPGEHVDQPDPGGYVDQADPGGYVDQADPGEHVDQAGPNES
jgi:hypothetical protein